MSAAPLTNQERTAKYRKLRVENYRKILLKMESGAMEVVDIADLLFIETNTARYYALAMKRFGVIQRTNRKHGYKCNTTAYIRSGDDAKTQRFLKFIAACETIEDELGKPRRKAEEISILSSRTVINTVAVQTGAKRDPLVAFLFGPPKGQGFQLGLLDGDA